MISESETILFADDDPSIREVLSLLLQSEGYQTIEASCGEEVLEKMTEDVDLIILDVMMPGMNGFTTCTRIREKSNVPILFLTAKSMESDKMLGFSAGGDDYLVKPFSYNELMLRVKAMLRRYHVYGAGPKTEDHSVISCFGDTEIDTETHTVRKNGSVLPLTELEYQILLLLVSNRKKIFSTQNIYESVWKEPYFYTSNNTVMVHIRNLRKKIGDDPQNSKRIQTVWGKGYRIE